MLRVHMIRMHCDLFFSVVEFDPKYLRESDSKMGEKFRDVEYNPPPPSIRKLFGDCSLSRWRPQKVDKRMVLEYTHGLFIT
jgi:hypothetical protein